MADIFDEIEEDLRRDKMNLLWQRYGNYILGLAVLIIIGVAGNQGYDYWHESKTQAAGNQFFEAVTAEDSLEALISIESDLPDGYKMLARFRVAALYAEEGDLAAAEQAFLDLSADTSIDVFYKNTALLLSVMNAPRSADKNQLINRISALAEFPGPLQGLALETSAGLYLEAGLTNKAIASLTMASSLTEIPASLRQRITQALSILSNKYADISAEKIE
ncbi:tetratricopeptide repeat protein [Alphaproteobacteria bacterium]|nr:tetratricopeptide repeat protein [Alphaproteobacteria bacterium]